MPKFSIITVCYNDAAALAATIGSVGSQSFTDFEYIVQDGNSTDATKDIVLGFRDWVNIFTSEPDQGIYDAMNKGVQSASGDYTIFLNAADLFFENKTLEKLNQLIEESDEIVHGMAVDADTGKTHNFRPLNDFSFGMVFDHQAAVVKTELLRKLPFDISLHVSADLDFFSRCRNNKTRFRHVELKIATKPYAVGASSEYLARFRGRSKILLNHFSDTNPELEGRLKTELLQYVQRTFGSEQLDSRLKDETIPEIINSIDTISSRLGDTLEFGSNPKYV